MATSGKDGSSTIQFLAKRQRWLAVQKSLAKAAEIRQFVVVVEKKVA
jgi:hypothetical protein